MHTHKSYDQSKQDQITTKASPEKSSLMTVMDILPQPSAPTINMTYTPGPGICLIACKARSDIYNHVRPTRIDCASLRKAIDVTLCTPYTTS